MDQNIKWRFRVTSLCSALINWGKLLFNNESSGVNHVKYVKKKPKEVKGKRKGKHNRTGLKWRKGREGGGTMNLINGQFFKMESDALTRLKIIYSSFPWLLRRSREVYGNEIVNVERGKFQKWFLSLGIFKMARWYISNL